MISYAFDRSRSVMICFGMASTWVTLLFLVATACADLLGGSSDDGHVARAWFAPVRLQFMWPATPAVSRGLVMLSDGSGIIAVDAERGTVRWQTRLFNGRAGNAGDVVVIGDRACIADNFGGSGCVDIQTGATIWTAPSDDSWSYQHAGDAHGFYFGTHEHEFLARNPGSGSLVWRLDFAPGSRFQSVARGATLYHDTLFVTTTRWLNANGFRSTGDLVAIDRITGEELWRFTPPGDKSDFQAGPTVSNGIAVVSDVRSYRLRAISLSTHQQLWESPVTDSGYVTAESQPVVDHDTVYAASSDTQIHAFDLYTGKPLWRVPGGAGSLGSVAVCGRVVLVVPWTNGPLLSVDRQTHKVVQPRVMVEDDGLFSRIAVDGNHAYAVGMKGVYAFRCAE